jgi:signal transduction histidine kinase
MADPKLDIYFLIFASIFLFLILNSFIIIFFNYYRKKQRKNFQEKEELKTIFQQELLQSKLEMQEQIFNNISQEIHDNVGQILSLAKVQVNIMNESGNMSPEMLNEVKENISKAMVDLRDIAKGLSSERIRQLSIHTAVANEAERMQKSCAINTVVSFTGEEKKMNDQKKLILFRLVQESLQNIIKHANASMVMISMNYTHDMLHLIIKDDGKGFDMEDALKKNAGLGLANIKVRTSLAGGSSRIESMPHGGTTVTIKMPYE